ncbi:MAG: hypothetical protein QW793_06160 [Candidatus Caldarchaeum sp.]
MSETIPVGALVRPGKALQRRYRGNYVIKSVDRYAVTLEPVGGGRPLYFGPKTFWKYWRAVLQS